MREKEERNKDAAAQGSGVHWRGIMRDFIIFEKDLEDRKEYFYYYLKYLFLYVDSTFFSVTPNKTISTNQHKEVVEETDEIQVFKITIEKVVMRDKRFNRYIQNLIEGTTAMDFASKVGVSRQTVSEAWSKCKELPRYIEEDLSRPFVRITEAQMEYVLGWVDTQPRAARNKVALLTFYMLYNIRKFKKFRKSQTKIAEELGLSVPFVTNGLQGLVESEIIDIGHKGNGIQGISTTYVLSEKMSDKINYLQEYHDGEEE